jgi:hypothetical protein
MQGIVMLISHGSHTVIAESLATAPGGAVSKDVNTKTLVMAANMRFIVNPSLVYLTPFLRPFSWSLLS